MCRDRDRRAYDLFDAALTMPPAQRAKYLAQKCGDDRHLHAEVEELFAADAAAHSFLDVQSTGASLLGTAGFSRGLGAIASSATKELLGEVVAHYRVREHLGAGGMGDVYRAHDEALGRMAALKVLRRDMPSEFQQRLLAEGQVNARLQHPAIATFYETGVAEGVAYIAMEYVQGTTLRAKLSDGSLNQPTSLDIAVALIRALIHAHAAGIVHGDIKPENIMLNSAGLLKLLDFGLARAIGEAADANSKSHHVAGTAGYMAPELVRGDAPNVQSDLFALGAVVYEMLSGRRAFEGVTPIERLSSALHRSPRPLSEKHKTEELWPVLARAMARSANHRYASAVEFLEAVEACGGRDLHRSTGPPLDVTKGRDSFVAAPAGRLNEQELQRLCQTGQQLLMRSEKQTLDQAARLFEDLRSQQPRCAPALAGLAAVHALRFTYSTNPQSLTHAVDLARQAVAVDSKLADAYIWLGYALYNQEKLLDGYWCVLQAIELEPDNFLAHYFAPGPLCMSPTRAQAAALLQRFEQNTCSAKEDPHRWRWKRAMAHLREAVRLNPQHAFSWLSLGWCHTELEEFSNAERCLRRAISLEETSPIPTSGAAGYLGECYRRAGALDEARAACLAGLEATEATDHMYRDTWRGVCLCSLGRTALDQGDKDAAQAAFNQAILHLRGRPRARAAGHPLVQALAGSSRATADETLFVEAQALNERRDRYDFRWLWGCSQDVTHLDLACAARDLGQEEIARSYFERAADYGSAMAMRELNRICP